MPHNVLCFGLLALRHVLAPLPGIESTPPALEGEVLTTGPPGKSPHDILISWPPPPPSQH